jgi:hypothetical protein
MDMEQDVLHGRTPGLLWWSLGAGFLAWGLDLGFGYVLAHHACAVGSRLELNIVTFISLLMALSGALPGAIAYRRLRRDTSEEGGSPHDRAHFQSLLGIAFSLSFALVIIVLAIPNWIHAPCG